MTAQVVGKPDDGDGLHDVGACGDEEDGHVSDVHAQAGGWVVWFRKRTLAEQDNVANARKKDAENDEAVAVAKLVRDERCAECDYSSHDPNWDAVNL